jgi:isocitrate lyase
MVADVEAGFGGPLNTFELMSAMIEAGAASVHFEDRAMALAELLTSLAGPSRFRSSCACQ